MDNFQPYVPLTGTRLQVEVSTLLANSVLVFPVSCTLASSSSLIGFVRKHRDDEDAGYGPETHKRHRLNSAPCQHRGILCPNGWGLEDFEESGVECDDCGEMVDNDVAMCHEQCGCCNDSVASDSTDADSTEPREVVYGPQTHEWHRLNSAPCQHRGILCPNVRVDTRLSIDSGPWLRRARCFVKGDR
jgi:hypothetical protein